jgi:hypothetical protein
MCRGSLVEIPAALGCASRSGPEYAGNRMLFFEGGHYGELKEALSAGLPVLFVSIAVSVLLVALAAIPPSALPDGILSNLVGPRRREVALVGAAIGLSAALVFVVVFWTL